LLKNEVIDLQIAVRQSVASAGERVRLGWDPTARLVIVFCKQSETKNRTSVQRL